MSQAASCKYLSPAIPTSSKCDNREILHAMEQFKNFYEEQLNEAVIVGAGDSTKLEIQQRWIEDLTEQMHVMARIVQELEDEASNRVRLLEEKLRHTSRSAYEVMKRYQNCSVNHNLDEPFQRIFHLESDLRSLLEFIRRARDEKRWCVQGLKFYEVSFKDLFGQSQKCECHRQGEQNSTEQNICTNKDATSRENVEQVVEIEASSSELSQQLNQKTLELEELRMSMLDMRTVLTEEVAIKHDTILALKKDIIQLEERCIQSDKQTAFKDDIIKELRKEIKQLKQQCRTNQVALQQQLEDALKKLEEKNCCVETVSACTYMDDETLIMGSNDLETELLCRRQEIVELKCKCEELESTLNSCQNRAENLQKAVDLYVNSIQVLEISEERSRIEIEQQKYTIANLQTALVGVKNELDEWKQNAQEVSVGWTGRWFSSSKSNQKNVHDV